MQWEVWAGDESAGFGKAIYDCEDGGIDLGRSVNKSIAIRDVEGGVGVEEDQQVVDVVFWKYCILYNC